MHKGHMHDAKKLKILVLVFKVNSIIFLIENYLNVNPRLV